MDPNTFHAKKIKIENDRTTCINDAFFMASYELNNQSITNRFRALVGTGSYELHGLRASVNNCDRNRDNMMEQIVKDIHIAPNRYTNS